ncbi:dihydroorotate dehydrogenase electron transfer subunit [Niallia sp.]|uniref:dihydroorotate dehydrogenase electron transfer subunit n=1 Tax=Niallia sp. TaxID=2837523 RepID=UPI00289899A7|nr:dihydroorotate dehydrogenase electron transfer subunit [Niallia sp.]
MAVKTEIIFNRQVSKRYFHLKVKVPDKQLFPVQAGQFFHIKCSDDQKPLLRRPFSIFRINEEEGTLEFLYLVKGIGTKALALRRPKEKLDILGPLGTSFTMKEESRNILVVARGVGIATLSALAFKAKGENVSCFAIISARSQEDYLVEAELKEAGVEAVFVNDEDGTSNPQCVRFLAETLIKEKKIDGIYTCGSRRLSILMKQLACEYELFAEIAVEENMGCGIGSCYGCVCNVEEEERIRPVRICMEGPVLPLKKVVFA